LDDDFAADLGDFRTMAEVRNSVRSAIENHHRQRASEAARQKVVDELVKRHDFVVPEQLVERQVRTRVERSLRSLARQGVDASKLNLDWRKVREAEREGAARDVKAGLLLERIATVENIQADEEEIDQQVQRYAKEHSMTAATARAKLAEDGTLDGLRSHLRNDKTLQFLLDEAHKVEATPEAEGNSSEAE
jgi:trigger factor